MWQRTQTNMCAVAPSAHGLSMCQRTTVRMRQEARLISVCARALPYPLAPPLANTHAVDVEGPGTMFDSHSGHQAATSIVGATDAATDAASDAATDRSLRPCAHVLRRCRGPPPTPPLPSLPQLLLLCTCTCRLGSRRPRCLRQTRETSMGARPRLCGGSSTRDGRMDAAEARVRPS